MAADFTREQLVAELMTEVRKEAGRFLFFHQAVAERLGLNTTDHKCLDLILHAQLEEGAPFMTAGQLARQTNLTTGAITGVIDRLERAGFIQRLHDEEDRRKVILSCCVAEADGKIAPLFEAFQRGFADLCAGYSDADLRLLCDFIARCSDLTADATRNLRLQPIAP